MEKKRWGAPAFAVALAVAFVLAAVFVLPAAGEETGAPPAVMEASALYGNAGRLGIYMPVDVRLYGQEQAGFSGSVCFSALESGNERETETYEYSYPVSLMPGEGRDDRYYVPLGQKSSVLCVALKDRNGEIVAEEQLRFEVPRETGYLFIGVLDEDFGGLSYLDDVGVNYGMVRTKLVELSADSFVDDARGFDLFDLLIINDFSTARLTGAQREALMEWVRDGGVLLLGTGARASDVLGPFAGDLVELPYEKPAMRTVNISVGQGESAPGNASVRMVCADLSIPGGDEVLSADEIPVLTMAARGNGKIGIFPFDLRDIAAFSEENAAYPDAMVTAALGEENVRNLYYYGSYGDDSEYWTAQGLVNTGSADRLPNLGLYAVVIFGYILIAGPGLYLILRRRGFGYYYGHAVILFSIAAAAVVYLMGVKTRFRSEFYTYASVRDVSGESVEEIVYLNIRTPDGRTYAADLGTDYQVSPITKSARYDETPSESFDRPGDGALTMNYGQSGTTIVSRKSRAFEPRLFKMTRRSENAEQGGILADVEYFEGTAAGTVTNRFDFPLENAALIFYGQVLPIGHLDAGETRTLSGEGLLTYPLDAPFVLAEMLGGGSRFERADIGNRDYLLAVERTNLYSFYIQRFFGSYTSGARVAAFASPEDAGAPFSKAGRTADGMVMVSSEANVTGTRGGRIYRSGLMRQPKMTSTGAFYSSAVNSVYGTDPVFMEYSLGNDIEVEQLSFLPVSPGFLDSGKYYYLRRFEGSASFYNYDTKAYDRVDLEQADFSAAQLEAYLSPSNSITVKYVGEGDDLAGSSALLPLPMVTGRYR